MSFFGKTKGAAKFTFVTIPSKVFGVGQIRSNHETIKALYKSLRNPPCPMCSRGVLSIRDDDAGQGEGDSRMYTWACNQCDFMLLGSKDQASILPTVTKLRQEQALEQFDGLAPDERQRFVKLHTSHSRVFFGAALLMFLGFCFMLIRGNGVMLSLNWLALAGCMFLLGLKKSYRAWQVEKGVLFFSGAFKLWFNNERWFR